ncbi:hypothetical protein N7495_009806 [Penicillium taxi]|uniref:uncharacterized protein n=1 Tax=Penicillium taxi TaxID=168475 RepID=UPI0025456996|nr:uncharacterized protein N7495_009806 [Penicillium taxi]KAJ5885296.1 hypothetical protein N7495_009806 [Penicillium taxi]
MRLSGLQSSRFSLHVPRRLHVPGPAQDSDVFADSLRKTLEAHRSSNRARLIRKVYPRAPALGLFRPYILPKNRAGYQPPEPPVAISEISAPESTKPAKRRMRGHVQEKEPLKNRPNAIRSANALYRRTHQQCPWLRHMAAPPAFGDASTFLDAEIQALDRYLTPSPDEQTQITKFTTELKSLLETVVSQPPQIIGSRCTGLALPHSNLHFLLPFEDIPRSLDRARRPSPTRPQIRDAHINLLHQVKSTLQSSPAFKIQAQLSGKRKTVLEAQHLPTGLQLLFHCGESVPAITEYIQDYLVEYPHLRPLYVGTRALLEAHGLFGSSHSSISPVALALLLVAFLKMNHGRFQGPHRLGDEFLALLQFYGTGVDLQTVVVAVDPPGFFDMETLRATVDDHVNAASVRGQKSILSAKRTAAARGNHPANRRLCIQDPTHYMNDLGRSCTCAPELQGVFAAAYKHLRHACDEWKGPSENSSSLLTTALRANFDQLEKDRHQIVRPVDLDIEAERDAVLVK